MALTWTASFVAHSVTRALAVAPALRPSARAIAVGENASAGCARRWATIKARSSPRRSGCARSGTASGDLVVFTGLRRGEACGLRWSDLDLDAATLTVNQQIVQLGWATQTGRPKSDAGERTIALDTDTVTLLGAHRRRQHKVRLAHGPGWLNTGLVFTDADGGPLHPAHVTTTFQQLIEEHDLPPIRLHDLRHGAATHALAAGVDARVVKETLGHSSTSFTRDTYQSVVDELKHQAAAALANAFNQAGARTWGTSSR